MKKRLFSRSLFLLVFYNDLAVLLLKLTDAFADQIQDLPVHGTTLVFGDIVQFSMQLLFHFNSQMLICFVSQSRTAPFTSYP